MNFTGIKVEQEAYIFDIQGLSVHDGPGCRTLVFMQGCTLNCSWCSNPEGISFNPSLLYNIEKCRLDGNCMKDCEFDAIEIVDNKLIINRIFCNECIDYPCLVNCYTKALRISSKKMKVSELFRVVNRDRQFWGQDGGVTLSGGEPLIQIDFVEEFLSRCHDAYIHTAIETCGNLPWKNYQRLLPYLDWIFIDFKHPDPTKHRLLTGADNYLILENISNLTKEFSGRLICRIPLIPEYNDSDETIEKYIDIFKELNIKEVNILPLHHLGREKYNLLNQEYKMDSSLTPSVQRLKEIDSQFMHAGIVSYVGSRTPF